MKRPRVNSRYNHFYYPKKQIETKQRKLVICTLMKKKMKMFKLII